MRGTNYVNRLKTILLMETCISNHYEASFRVLIERLIVISTVSVMGKKRRTVVKRKKRR